MTGPSLNDLSVARASGVLAANAGDDRNSCLWESGPMRDAWLAGYDAHVQPLNKVLPAGGPLHPAMAAMHTLDSEGRPS